MIFDQIAYYLFGFGFGVVAAANRRAPVALLLCAVGLLLSVTLLGEIK